MTKDILGNPVKLGRRYKDGSRPFHSRAQCRGADQHPCPWHAPSKHGMRNFTRVIRFDKYGLVERICSHGCGHPDPDSAAFLAPLLQKEYGWAQKDADMVLGTHGCDGCHS